MTVTANEPAELAGPTEAATDTEGAEEDILVSVDAEVCVVTFNRPAERNAMTKAMGRRYAEVLRAADRDPDVRAVVLTGAGRAFCSGADVSVLRRGAAAIRDFIPPPEDMPALALDLTKPVIAAINGPAIGIGFVYALASDIRIAEQSATLATLFSRLGLVAEYGLSWLLPRVVGVPAALDLLLSGRTIRAEEAERLGLVHRVVPRGTALAAAREYATDLVRSCAPFSLRQMKEQLYADLGRSREAALIDTLARMDASFDRPDLAEALAARDGQRAAVFQCPAGPPAA